MNLQTFIRAAQKRDLRGATTNGNQSVQLCLSGDNNQIEELISLIKSGKELNSCGARVDKLEELDYGIAFEYHATSTHNYEMFNWNDDDLTNYI